MPDSLQERAAAVEQAYYDDILNQGRNAPDLERLVADALRAERAAALEEAAKVLDAKAEWAASLGYNALADALREQAAAIRKLKEQP